MPKPVLRAYLCVLHRLMRLGWSYRLSLEIDRVRVRLED